MVASLQDGPQWSLPPTIHALCGFLPHWITVMCMTMAYCGGGWGVTSEASLSKALWFPRWPLGLLMLKNVCRHFVRVLKQPCGKASVENWDLLPTASTKRSTVWVSHPINSFFRWLQPDQHPECSLMRDSQSEPASSTTLTFLTHRNDRR